MPTLIESIIKNNPKSVKEISSLTDALLKVTLDWIKNLEDEDDKIDLLFVLGVASYIECTRDFAPDFKGALLGVLQDPETQKLTLQLLHDNVVPFSKR